MSVPDIRTTNSMRYVSTGHQHHTLSQHCTAQRSEHDTLCPVARYAMSVPDIAHQARVRVASYAQSVPSIA
eukprot:2914492-Rhodomonas_salina.1